MALQQRQFTSPSTSSRDIPIKMTALGVPSIGPGVDVPTGAYVQVTPLGGNASDNCFVSTAATDTVGVKALGQQYKRTTLPQRIRVRNLQDIAVWSDTAGDGVIVSIQIDS